MSGPAEGGAARPEGSGSGHQLVNPPQLGPAVGFSHAVVAAAGRVVYLAGQDGAAGGEDLVEQFDRAAGKLLTALRAAGGEARHLVWLQIFVTDLAGYRAAREPIGRAYRRHFGRHYPAMGLFEVSGLFEPGARVELMGIAVVPEG